MRAFVAVCLAALPTQAIGFAVHTPLKRPLPQLTPPAAPVVMSGIRSDQPTPSEGAFAAKVFGTLGVQLGATAAAATTIVHTPQLHALVNGDHFLFGLFFFISLGLALFSRAANQQLSMPAKIAYLSVFTLAESWLLGGVCSSYVDAGLGNLILQAAGITSFDVAVLTSYALLSGEDFSYLGSALYAGLLALIGGGLVQLGCSAIPSLASTVPAQELALSVVGSVVFCLYIVYDVARLRGDFIERDDYLGATMNLYLDIINLFLNVLRILSSTSSKDSD